MSNRKGLLALSPLFVFVTIYLVASIIAQDFYKVPISVAFVIASIYAVAISYKNGLRQSVDIFSNGASKSNIMLMLWISYWQEPSPSRPKPWVRLMQRST